MFDLEDFSENLIKWYQIHKRDLPWRNTRDPFKIWLSEIILQQTRVAQGLNYYLKFIDRFENVKNLAEATEDEILSMWQGLGYYSRGRNLRKAAIQVMEEYNGKFPTNSNELKKLKGIGDYSSAAIASFSSNERIAVVDGNVYRVLSRLFGIKTPIDSTSGKKQFSELANILISEQFPAQHNQAIMEFGAKQCTPKNPSCDVCIFSTNCEAFSLNSVFEFPRKNKKIKKTSRYFHFFVDVREEFIVLEKRSDKGIWANLYQLPLIESEVGLEQFGKPIFQTKHTLTHQNLYCSFYQSKTSYTEERILVKISALQNYALPIVIDKFLRQYFN